MTPQGVIVETCRILKVYGDPSVTTYTPDTKLDTDLKLVGVRARQCTHALDYFLFSTPKKGRLKVREFKKAKTVGHLCIIMVFKALGVKVTPASIATFIQKIS
ncbi:hypothetical protein [Pseudoalteromonas gelatinilytica]|uniref:Uncharacterized protein n=1 Tax=Pseudoalteromonas gelatinilytica TaxID=1703256 RepID=A0ABQ1TLJ2_9GAMM|nr:hypothetical protein [Pseudoalteromonas profundi]GGE96313.1 hypothetical protein GCM10008027_21690 [Pseudoalteromonas profundi]